MKNLTLTLTAGLIAATSPLLAGGTVTPEPSTMLLMAGGLGAMILIARKVRKK